MGTHRLVWVMVGLFLLLQACATTRPSPDVNFVLQSNRADWKEKIDSSEVGFYAPDKSMLIGLDAPPHNEGGKTVIPMIGLNKPCRKYLREHGAQILQLEFLVDDQGTPSQFHALRSAGPCDDNIAVGVKKANIVPGLKNGRPKAALVHMRFSLKVR